MVKTERVLVGGIMRKKRFSFPLSVFFIFIFTTISVSASNDRSPPSAERGQPEVLFVYGEVVAIDGIWNSVTIRHFDYTVLKNDDLEIALKETTEWENVPGMRQLNIGDWAGVTYVIQPNGNRMAESISVEKTEKKIP